MKTYLSMALVSIFLLSGCSQPTDVIDDTASADAFYQSYLAHVRKGITFEQDKKYWTQAQLAEASSMITSFMEASGKTKSEVVDIYLDTSLKMAECLRLTLEEEQVVGPQTTLIYQATDSCSNNQTISQKVVIMQEDGWKLSLVETFI
jgi:UDP-3-O-[3-hydroxymyristoyl] glucosamine N-acyltransferase